MGGVIQGLSGYCEAGVMGLLDSPLLNNPGPRTLLTIFSNTFLIGESGPSFPFPPWGSQGT